LSGKKGEGLGNNCLPVTVLKKAMILRITLRYFSKLDLTQIFDKTFYQFAHSTTTFLAFSSLAFQSRASKGINLNELEILKL